MTVGPDIRVRLARNVFARDFDGETVLVDLERGDYFGLDELGSRVWEELATGASPTEIAANLVNEYDVELNRLQGDLVQLVTLLMDHGLVEKV